MFVYWSVTTDTYIAEHLVVVDQADGGIHRFVAVVVSFRKKSDKRVQIVSVMTSLNSCDVLFFGVFVLDTGIS